jgi:hypothetical protein
MAKRGPKPDSYAAKESDYATNYVLEYVKCGKPNCKRCHDPEQPGHGPYWYSYHYSPTQKKYIKKYVGKQLPDNVSSLPFTTTPGS